MVLLNRRVTGHLDPVMRQVGHKPDPSFLIPFPSGWRVFTVPMILSNPDQIEAYRLLVIRSGLKLESLGMKHSSGRSMLSIVKAMGIKARTAKAALPLFEQYLKDQGVLR